MENAENRIISIVNQKGGVGKTTSAVNIASFLAELGHRTLLIDLDPQANSTSGTGIELENVTHTLYHLLIENCPVEKVLYASPFENLHIIPANPDLAGAEIELVDVVSRETILKRKLETIRQYYAYIIIDCPPSLGLLTLNALCASDYVLIPVQTEYFALEGLSHLVRTISLVQEDLNPELKVAGIVLTMFDKRTALHRQVVHDARSFFQDMVFQAVIPRNVRLTEAPSHGLPIALYSPNSKGYHAYLDLAKEVIERVK